MLEEKFQLSVRAEEIDILLRCWRRPKSSKKAREFSNDIQMLAKRSAITN